MRGNQVKINREVINEQIDVHWYYFECYMVILSRKKNSTKELLKF